MIEEVRACVSKQKGFSGVILLQQGSETLYAGAFGLANRSFEIPNALDIRFSHASVTKLFTATAVMHLVERGLELTTSVAEYLDIDLDSKIIVSHLLTHTSGLSDYFDEGDPQGFEKVWSELPNYSMASVSDFLPLILGCTQDHSPGTAFSYCNAGYLLLGLVIEKASGISYYDYIRQNIFSRAGMEASDFISMDQVQPRVAEGYIPWGEGWRRNVYALPAYGAPDGGSYATAQDLIRFMQALRGGKLLTREGLKMMQTPQVHVWEEIHYGYGLWIQVQDGQTVRFGGIGEDPGASARIYTYPQTQLDLAILSNHSDGIGSLIEELSPILQGGEYGG